MTAGEYRGHGVKQNKIVMMGAKLTTQLSNTERLRKTEGMCMKQNRS